MVESDGHLRKTRAQCTVSVEPVGKRIKGSVIGQRLARGRLKAKETDHGKRHLYFSSMDPRVMCFKYVSGFDNGVRF